MSEVPRLMSRSSGLIWEHIHPHECISLPISNTGCPDERKKAYFANQFRKTFFTNIYHPFNTTVNTLRKQRCRMIDKSATHLLVILFPTIPYLWNNSLQMRVAKWRWKALWPVSTHLNMYVPTGTSVSAGLYASIIYQKCYAYLISGMFIHLQCICLHIIHQLRIKCYAYVISGTCYASISFLAMHIYDAFKKQLF